MASRRRARASSSRSVKNEATAKAAMYLEKLHNFVELFHSQHLQNIDKLILDRQRNAPKLTVCLQRNRMHCRPRCEQKLLEQG